MATETKATTLIVESPPSEVEVEPILLELTDIAQSLVTPETVDMITQYANPNGSESIKAMASVVAYQFREKTCQVKTLIIRDSSENRRDEGD